MDAWLEIRGITHVPVEWDVCGDCHRAYRRGEHRAMWVLHEDDSEEELMELCPYPDCCATTRHDGIDWASLAQAHPDSLPHVPENGGCERTRKEEWCDGRDYWQAGDRRAGDRSKEPACGSQEPQAGSCDSTTLSSGTIPRYPRIPSKGARTKRNSGWHTPTLRMLIPTLHLLG